MRNIHSEIYLSLISIFQRQASFNMAYCLSEDYHTYPIKSSFIKMDYLFVREHKVLIIFVNHALTAPKMCWDVSGGIYA